jgi:hypothetical protein
VRRSARAVNRRNQPEEQGASHREEPQYGHGRSVDSDFLRTGEVGRAEIAQQRDAGVGERDSNGRRAQREQRALRQQVPHDASARRAERGANGQFPPPAGHARDQQVRRIRARDQPHQRDGGQREPRDRPDVADDVRPQIHHGPGGLVVLVRRAPDWENPFVDRAKLLRGGRSRRAGGETSDRRDQERPFPRRRRPLGRHEERMRLLERADARRQDADERVVRAVEADRPADRVVASAQPLLPEAMAHDDRRRRARLTVGFPEVPPHDRPDAEQSEVRPRHNPSAESLGGIAVVERHRPIRVGRDLFELSLLGLQCQVVGKREPPDVGRRVRVEADELVRIRVGERPQKRRVDRAEDGGRGADAETDGGDDRQRHHRRPAQPSKTDSKILREVFEHQPPPHRILLSIVLPTAIFASGVQIAELPERFTASAVIGPPARFQIVAPHLQMEVELFVDVRSHVVRSAAQVPEGTPARILSAHSPHRGL